MTSLTTAQISRLTAGITGTAPKGASTKEAAAARFRKVLAEAIGQMNADARADNILGAASFDEATDFLRIALGRRPEQAPEADEKAEKPAHAAKTLGKRAAVLEAAKGGQLPPKPDFSAPTHARFPRRRGEPDRGQEPPARPAGVAGARVLRLEQRGRQPVDRGRLFPFRLRLHEPDRLGGAGLQGDQAAPHQERAGSLA